MATRTESRNYAANPAELPRGTLVELFLDTVDHYGTDEAFRHMSGERWESITYDEFAADVRRLSSALKELGVERGDRVAILSENRPEWPLADYAALCTGAQDVPIYATLPAEQIVYLLKDSGARVCFVSTRVQLDKVLEVSDELPALERVIVFDDDVTADAAGDLEVTTLRTFLEGAADAVAEAGSADAFRREALRADPNDVATILYTSGTTGRPKGVMLTHNNIFTNTRAVDDVLPISTEDVTLSFLPLSHILQRMVEFFLFSKGCAIAYAQSMETVADDLEAVEPTIVVSVPRLYEKIYAKVMAADGLRGKLVAWAAGVGDRWAEARIEGRTPSLATRLQHTLADRLVFSKIRQRTGGRLRFFISGGAPLNADIARFFYAAGILILEGYGLSETSPVTNVNTPEDFRFGTVGGAVLGTEVMIADDGEILIRGPQVMKGYYNLPEETEAALDADGWFHTGDVGEIDADGKLRITDRKKDLIVTAGGKKIAPQPIEGELKTNRFVGEAVMVGDRRPFAVLLVVPNFENLTPWAEDNGVSVTDASALIDNEKVQQKMETEVFGMLDALARFETPKKIALLAEAFSIEAGELTPTLKVRRDAVEEKYATTLEALYAADRDVRVIAEQRG